MCYSTDDLVRLRAEVTYNETLPYGTNGYRTDCSNVKVNGSLASFLRTRCFSIKRSLPPMWPGLNPRVSRVDAIIGLSLLLVHVPGKNL